MNRAIIWEILKGSEKKLYFFFILLYLFVIISSGIQQIQLLSYVIIPVNLFFIFYFFKKSLTYKNGNLQVNILLLIFFWCITTALWSANPFLTLTRSLLFLINAAGTIFVGYSFITYYKENGLKYFINATIVLNIVFIFVNFLALFFLFGWFRFGAVSAFQGVTIHPNKLGQILFLFSLPLLYKLNAKSFLPGFLVLMNISFLVLSNSRGALLAFLFFALLVFLNAKFGWRKLLLGSLTTLFLVFIFNNEIIHYLKKDEASFGQNRIALIDASCKAALNGGLIGLGYGISSKEVNLKIGESGLLFNNFKREKMISSLAAVEEIGFVGLALFISLFFLHLKKLYQYRTLRFSLITIFFVISLHIYAQIEAWWLSVRSIPFLFYFLIIGISYGHIQQEKRLLNNEKINS